MYFWREMRYSRLRRYEDFSDQTRWNSIRHGSYSRAESRDPPWSPGIVCPKVIPDSSHIPNISGTGMGIMGDGTTVTVLCDKNGVLAKVKHS